MGMRWIWDRYEALFAKVLGLRPLAPDSLLLVRWTTYRGRPLYAGDQALLPGMRVLDLHLNNRRIAEQGPTAVAAAWRIRARVRQELPLLYRLMQGASPPAAAVVGTSLLSMGARDMGFHVVELPPGFTRWWFGIYMRWLDRLYRPGSTGRRRQPHRRQVAMLWMTYAELERLVVDTPPGAADPAGCRTDRLPGEEQGA